MSNRVVVDTDGTVRVFYGGKQTRISGKQIADKCKEYSQALQKENRRVRFLVDLDGLTASDSEFRKVLYNLIQTLHYDRIAFAGGSVFVKNLVKMVVYASVREDWRIKFFSSEDHARDWLMRGDRTQSEESSKPILALDHQYHREPL